MPANAVIISEPAVDFPTYLATSLQMLGYNPADTVDASKIDRSDTERFLSCLAAMKDQRAPAGLTPNYLHFACFGLLIAADERDMIDILNVCAGMPTMSVDTVFRGVLLTVVFGNLADWRDAVVTGTAPDAEQSVRSLFNLIHGLFQSRNLGSVWKDWDQRHLPDRTYVLEYKRR